METIHERSLDENVNKETLYNVWAKDYDNYLKKLGYTGPENMAELLSDHIDNKEVILDFGCGTGLLGQEIKKKIKPKYLYGVDISMGMIAKSMKKKIYNRLFCLDLSKDSSFSIENLSVVVSCGVFLEGHVSFEIIPKIMNLLKVGGRFFFTTRLSFYEKNKDLLGKILNKYKTIFITNLNYLPNVDCLAIGIKKI